MGSFKAGQWIIVLLIYFTVYFLIVWGALNLQAVYGYTDTSVHYTDPGFYQYASYSNYGGKCSPPGEIKRFSESAWNIGLFGNCTPTNNQRCGISCDELDTNNRTCTNVVNCTWINDTDLFGFTVFPAHCDGLVDNIYYNISEHDSYCSAPGLQNEILCNVFKCSWSNTSAIYVQEVSLLKPQKGMVMFYETAKFMLGMRVDFGLMTFGWLWAFFFTYIELLMLFFSIYMALPFLHGSG